MLPWLVAGVVFLIAATGDLLGPLSPGALLRAVPVFSSARVPSRFLIPFTLTAGVMAAFGVDTLQKRLGRFGNALAHLAVGALLIDCRYVASPNLRHMHGGFALSLPDSTEFHQLELLAARTQILAYAKANMGVVRCYEYTAFASAVRGADQPSYRGEEYLLGVGDLRATGLLAVRVPAGSSHVRLVYGRGPLWIGVVITASTALVALLAAFRA